MRKIEHSVFDIPLILSVSLEDRREELNQDLINAQRRLRDFALRHTWGRHVEACFAKRAEIYDDQGVFIRALLETAGADPSTELPYTISASLENDVFMSVSPDLYNRIYPEGIEDHSFEKLITHEMGHRLHIRILGGNEDAMGPVWFYEGFAVLAADQFRAIMLEPGEIREVIREKERGSYLKYGAAIRYYLKSIPLESMVEHAGQEGFIEWLDESSQRRIDE